MSKPNDSKALRVRKTYKMYKTIKQQHRELEYVGNFDFLTIFLYLCKETEEEKNKKRGKYEKKNCKNCAMSVEIEWVSILSTKGIS